MVWPKVSIIWLNYNSSRILPIVLESLESVVGLDYPSDRYELIVVDNGSTDGSFEKVKDFLESRSSLKKRIIRLGRNLGFTGGNNIGFTARDRESKYVLLLNNDAIIFQEGLKTLVEYAENYSDVACLQGVVLKYGTRLIDTAGCYVDELLQTHAVGEYHEYPWILSKPVHVTYVSGSCALYGVEHVLKCIDDKLFIDEFFGYGDDNVLGLMMWNCRRRSVAIPEVVASHVGGLTFGRRKSISSIYLSERNRVALSVVTNTRYKYIILSHELRNAITSVLRVEAKGLPQVRVRALYDGIKLGERLRSKGLYIDVYKAPLVKIPLRNIGGHFIARRVIVKYFEDWIAKNLSFLTVE
jgi:GT2 family glycosyltransferase